MKIGLVAILALMGLLIYCLLHYFILGYLPGIVIFILIALIGFTLYNISQGKVKAVQTVQQATSMFEKGSKFVENNSSILSGLFLFVLVLFIFSQLNVPFEYIVFLAALLVAGFVTKKGNVQNTLYAVVILSIIYIVGLGLGILKPLDQYKWNNNSGASSEKPSISIPQQSSSSASDTITFNGNSYQNLKGAPIDTQPRPKNAMRVGKAENFKQKFTAPKKGFFIVCMRRSDMWLGAKIVQRVDFESPNNLEPRYIGNIERGCWTSIDDSNKRDVIVNAGTIISFKLAKPEKFDAISEYEMPVVWFYPQE